MSGPRWTDAAAAAAVGEDSERLRPAWASCRDADSGWRGSCHGEEVRELKGRNGKVGKVGKVGDAGEGLRFPDLRPIAARGYTIAFGDRIKRLYGVDLLIKIRIDI